jgi:hypothetical protein
MDPEIEYETRSFQMRTNLSQTVVSPRPSRAARSRPRTGSAASGPARPTSGPLRAGPGPGDDGPPAKAPVSGVGPQAPPAQPLRYTEEDCAVPAMMSLGMKVGRGDIG